MIKFASSLKITLVLMICAMGLVFFGTLDQVHYGIYEVQKRYFSSWIAIWEFGKIGLPMPGGILLGLMFLINLSAASVKYFSLKPQKWGILAIHGGIVLLVLSGFTTYFFQEETQMWIAQGGSSNYSKANHENEFVIIDKSAKQTDTVFALDLDNPPVASKIGIEGTPFDIEFLDFYENADIGLAAQNPDIEPSEATHGAAKKMGLVVFPQEKSVKDEQPNAYTGHVRVYAGSIVVGTWLVSNIFDERFPPQAFDYEGKSYELAIRFKRTYFPFSLKLNKFTHEVHPGTDIPSNFASDLTLVPNDEKTPARDVLVYMNNPLRILDYTFFQASFASGGDESMLQVVKNPSRLLPYASVMLVGVGLVYHFIVVMLKARRRREAK